LDSDFNLGFQRQTAFLYEYPDRVTENHALRSVKSRLALASRQLHLPSSMPLIHFMDDRDNDGVVCE